MKKFSAALVAGTIVTASIMSAVANADDRKGWGPGWGMGRMMMDEPMMGRYNMAERMMGYGPAGMLDRIDGRLAFIKAELNIRDDQSDQWDTLARVIRDNAEVHNKMMRSMTEDMHDGEYFKKPLPDRLTIMETHMEARLEQVRTVREALTALYAVLGDDQKKAANEVVLPVMGMGMGMMMQ